MSDSNTSIPNNSAPIIALTPGGRTPRQPRAARRGGQRDRWPPQKLEKKYREVYKQTYDKIDAHELREYTRRQNAALLDAMIERITEHVRDKWDIVALGGMSIERTALLVRRIAVEKKAWGDYNKGFRHSFARFRELHKAMKWIWESEPLRIDLATPKLIQPLNSHHRTASYILSAVERLLEMGMGMGIGFDIQIVYHSGVLPKQKEKDPAYRAHLMAYPFVPILEDGKMIDYYYKERHIVLLRGCCEKKHWRSPLLTMHRAWPTMEEVMRLVSALPPLPDLRPSGQDIFVNGRQVRQVVMVVCRESGNVEAPWLERDRRRLESIILAERFVQGLPFDWIVTAERLDRPGTLCVPTNAGAGEGDADMFARLTAVKEEFPDDQIEVHMIWRGPDGFCASPWQFKAWSSHWERQHFNFHVYVYQTGFNATLLQKPFIQQDLQWSDTMIGFINPVPMPAAEVSDPPAGSAAERLFDVTAYLAQGKMDNPGRAGNEDHEVYNLSRNDI